MGTKVCKFGGSSLADAQQLQKVREIVEADSARRFVVPSAPGRRSASDTKVTDLLYRCRELQGQGESIDKTFAEISERYQTIVSDLGTSLDLRPQLDEVRARIEAGASADYVASRGEFLNGLVVADLLHFEFVDAADLVRFDADGRFDAELTQTTLETQLEGRERIVVPGFYGSNPSGEIVTFSRGGSDVTGAILARGVGADLYENWTDVSGMRMADPRIVENPALIEQITYRELRELAYMGATVLHEDAIFPVRAAGIPIHIRNTNAPDEPGTLILRSPTSTDRPPRAITGIAGRKDFTIVYVEKTLMNAEVGFARRMLGVLERHQIPFEHLPSGIDTMSLVLHSSFVDDRLDAICAEIERECQPDSIEAFRDMALIATVGRGMMHTPGMAARLFGALAGAGVNIRMIDQGSSELNIIVGIESGDFDAAVRAIYSAFVS